MIKKIIIIIVMLWSKVWTFKTNRRFVHLIDFMYSNWIKNSFKKCGENILILRPFYLKGGENIEIGENFNAGHGLRIETWDSYQGDKFSPKIIIGDNVCFNFDCHVGAINKIEICDNVLIGSRVLITDHNHSNATAEHVTIAPSLRPLTSNGNVVISKNVWIGENVSILSGVTIGENSIVAANSVVTKSMPANSVIAGVPARVIKQIKIDI